MSVEEAGSGRERHGDGDSGERANPGESTDQQSHVMSPSAELRPLSDEQLAVLRQVGDHWSSALQGAQSRLARLPVDPALGSYGREPQPSRWDRFARVAMFRAEAPDELVATPPATEPETRFTRVLSRMRRAVVGPPLHSAAVVQERMRKLIALPVLSSDLLSSVAYGPEAMLTVLVLAGPAALGLSLPVAAALIILMIAVGLSYRQTIPAYPHGAGSYIVAGDNLGPRLGLVAAAGLMMDYILTVSVSVAAGVDAITSALPGLGPYGVVLGLIALAVLLAANLRGVRSAGNVFAAPTYAFLAGMILLISVGVVQAAARGFASLPAPPSVATEGAGVLLVLRAFSSGATSMTGIEAVSNAVPAFRDPTWRNARTTLTWMIGLLVVIFAGLVLLTHLNGIAPQPGETVLSQLAQRVFHSGPLYGYVQTTTALILLLAANTAFNDFPRLLFFLARDAYAPRKFLRMGDRLAFSNGILVLALASAVLLVAFSGRTESLIPLYAIGVFLAFTLSQTGMVVHWWRARGAHWRKSITFNLLGACLSAVVLLTAAISKLTEGAWVVVLAVPLVIVVCRRIRAHYDTVRAATDLYPLPSDAAEHLVEPPRAPDTVPRPLEPAAPTSAEPGQEEGEREESPEQIRHLVVVPVARMDLAALRALAYAASLTQPVLAVHISPDEQEAEQFRRNWNAWGNHVRLEIISSPYRAIIAPLAHYLEALHAQWPAGTLTVVLPEIAVNYRRHEILHSQAPQRLRRALRHVPRLVVSSVPIHLSTGSGPTRPTGHS